MQTTRFEEMYNAELRRADRQLIFAALRERRGHTGVRRLMGGLLWMLGLR